MSGEAGYRFSGSGVSVFVSKGGSSGCVMLHGTEQLQC